MTKQVYLQSVYDLGMSLALDKNIAEAKTVIVLIKQMVYLKIVAPIPRYMSLNKHDFSEFVSLLATSGEYEFNEVEGRLINNIKIRLGQ